MGLELDLLDGRWAIARLDPGAPPPAWASGEMLSAVVRTAGELTVVAPAERVPEDVRAEGPWAALQVRGPLDFALTGILASLAAALADAGVPLFALSTFDTDVLLVREGDLERARAALAAAGHLVHRG